MKFYLKKIIICKLDRNSQIMIHNLIRILIHSRMSSKKTVSPLGQLSGGFGVLAPLNSAGIKTFDNWPFDKAKAFNFVRTFKKLISLSDHRLSLDIRR